MQHGTCHVETKTALATFKSHVVLEMLKEEKAVSQIAAILTMATIPRGQEGPARST